MPARAEILFARPLHWARQLLIHLGLTVRTIRTAPRAYPESEKRANPPFQEDARGIHFRRSDGVNSRTVHRNRPTN